MKIIENSIQFKSNPDFYRRELHGGKHNTIRKVTDADIKEFGLELDKGTYRTALYSNTLRIDFIVIHCGKYCFNRKLSDVSDLSDVLNCNGLWAFSWWPSETHK